MAHFESKHGTVCRSREELYMAFVDLSNFTRMLPEQYKNSVSADYDNLTATVQGFSISVGVSERRPYELVRIISTDSPVEFSVSLHFDPAGDDSCHTDFSIELDADLNVMMKAMVGGRIKDGLDKIVDSLVGMSFR